MSEQQKYSESQIKSWLKDDPLGRGVSRAFWLAVAVSFAVGVLTGAFLVLGWQAALH